MELVGEAPSGVRPGTQSDTLEIEHSAPREGLKFGQKQLREWKIKKPKSGETKTVVRKRL